MTNSHSVVTAHHKNDLRDRDGRPAITPSILTKVALSVPPPSKPQGSEEHFVQLTRSVYTG